MMEHPVHLHGMWMQMENNPSHDRSLPTSVFPLRNTGLVKPGEKVSMLITPIEKGYWVYHCHLLQLFFHMETGMFQTVHVA